MCQQFQSFLFDIVSMIGKNTQERDGRASCHEPVKYCTQISEITTAESIKLEASSTCLKTSDKRAAGFDVVDELPTLVKSTLDTHRSFHLSRTAGRPQVWFIKKLLCF